MFKHSEKVTKARSIAIEKHRNQKYGNRPYIFHLDEVATKLIMFGVIEEDLLCAAYLHDILEDTDYCSEELRSNFGNEVLDIVLAVTDEPGLNRAERKIKTYPKIKNNKKAIIVKLADRISNLENALYHNKIDFFKTYKKEQEHFSGIVKTSDLEISALEKSMWDHLDKLLKVF
jgi:(p)ppGpp synthase/HD superfamily hydrolase